MCVVGAARTTERRKNAPEACTRLPATAAQCAPPTRRPTTPTRAPTPSASRPSCRRRRSARAGRRRPWHAAALDQQRREAVLSQREAVEAASRAAEARVRRELAEAMRDAEHERAEAQRLRELREDAADQEDRVRRDLRSGRLLAAVEERERAADMDASSTRRAESRLRARLEEEHEAALRHAVAAAEQRVRRELGGAGGGRRAEAAEAEVARAARRAAHAAGEDGRAAPGPRRRVASRAVGGAAVDLDAARAVCRREGRARAEGCVGVGRARAAAAAGRRRR